MMCVGLIGLSGNSHIANSYKVFLTNPFAIHTERTVTKQSETGLNGLGKKCKIVYPPFKMYTDEHAEKGDESEK